MAHSPTCSNTKLLDVCPVWQLSYAFLHLHMNLLSLSKTRLHNRELASVTEPKAGTMARPPCPPACAPLPTPRPPRIPTRKKGQRASIAHCCVHEEKQPEAHGHVWKSSHKVYCQDAKGGSWLAGAHHTLPTSFSGTPLKRAKNSTCSLPVISSVMASNWGQ